MIIPYRIRCFLRRAGIFLVLLAVVAVVLTVIMFADLEQYIVYTQDGIKFDFSQSSKNLSGQVPQPTVIEDPIGVQYFDSSVLTEDDKELSPINGYYITAKELEKDIDAVREQLKRLPAKTPVMIDLKSIYGNFFYSSAVSSNRNEDLDVAAMDELIRELCSGKYYAIGRLPALRDMLYGLNNVTDGLPVAAGYLWMDSEGCYWLNPKSDGTVTYLANIANELKNLGFDEVVFCDYCFPETDKIVFKDDKQKALADTAQTLINSCASDTFAVSFTVKSYFDAPRGRSRMYLESTAAAEAEAQAAQFGFEDPETRVVFLTEIHDTRFDEFSVLRPIADAE